MPLKARCGLLFSSQTFGNLRPCECGRLFSMPRAISAPLGKRNLTPSANSFSGRAKAQRIQETFEKKTLETRAIDTRSIKTKTRTATNQLCECVALARAHTNTHSRTYIPETNENRKREREGNEMQEAREKLNMSLVGINLRRAFQTNVLACY